MFYSFRIIKNLILNQTNCLFENKSFSIMNNSLNLCDPDGNSHRLFITIKLGLNVGIKVIVVVACENIW